MSTESMQEKLARMANKSKQKVEAVKNEKVQNWKRVQAECPEIAQTLISLGNVFGKLALVEVTLTDTGEFLKIR